MSEKGWLEKLGVNLTTCATYKGDDWGMWEQFTLKCWVLIIRMFIKNQYEVQQTLKSEETHDSRLPTKGLRLKRGDSVTYQCDLDEILTWADRTLSPPISTISIQPEPYPVGSKAERLGHLLFVALLTRAQGIKFYQTPIDFSGACKYFVLTRNLQFVPHLVGCWLLVLRRDLSWAPVSQRFIP